MDGVTRTLARLLEHLSSEGHTALVLGPESGMVSSERSRRRTWGKFNNANLAQTTYAGHEVIGTKGIPLLGIYNGLKLNFIRPKFIRRLSAYSSATGERR